jgi:ACS family hexuronate transporter-like MFS transporter
MRLRWVVLAVFAAAAALNYLDRQILPALAPALRDEFHLSNADYGLVLAAFSIAYAAAAPFAGLFIDRIGLNRGASFAVALWSLAGIATARVGNLGALVACRAWLGAAQAGGVPASGKAIAIYLKPEERALGNAVSQAGMTVGAMLAPPVAVWLAMRYGWRSAFLVTGIVSLLWVPVWSRVAAKEPAAPHRALSASAVFRDRRLWSFLAATALGMTVYTLWTNWTTVFLADVHHLPLAKTAQLAWLPPVFFNLGGLAGGWLSMRWIRRGVRPLDARLRACYTSAVALLATAAAPLMPGPGSAIAVISVSAFWSSALSVNLYTMPLDVYGAERAAFTVAMLTAAYGAMQAIFSPAAGRLIDMYGFTPVCVIVALLPLAGCAVLAAANPRRSAGPQAIGY